MFRAILGSALVLSACYASKTAERSPVARPGPQQDASRSGRRVATAADGPCPAPALGPRKPWRHQVAAAATTTLMGAPHHAASDPVLNRGSDAHIRGKFAYGITSKDLEDEEIALWVQVAACGPWHMLEAARTDHDGRVRFAVPAKLIQKPGAYPFQLVVAGDQSRSYGTIFVLERGTRAAVFDIDGTLTTSDSQLASKILLGTDPSMRAGASAVARTLAQRGYVLVYLTGRPYFLRESTRDWLMRHQFPRGVLITTDSLRQSRPSREHVGAFKRGQLEALIEGAGIDVRYAFGNAGTDVCAYAEAGVSPARTYIAGKHGGEACGTENKTHAIRDFVPLLRALQN